jgi:hypothetical protein
MAAVTSVAMHEYANVSVSSYDPASLAAKLTEKSAEGWDVVAIVPTGGDTTAFLRRASSTATPAAATAAVTTIAEPTPAPTPAPAPSPEPAAYAPAPAPAPSPATEPAGWGMAPEASSPSATPAQTAVPVSAAPAQTAAATPAGWYHDPSGRFELRYWDGGQWTEHVARAGQQYTDPPVA